MGEAKSASLVKLIGYRSARPVVCPPAVETTSALGSSVRQHVDQLTRGLAVRHSGLEVEHLATVAGLIGNGLGVSLVPELTLFQFRSLDLVAIPLDTAAVMRPILIVQRKGGALSHAAQGMLDMIETRLCYRKGVQKCTPFSSCPEPSC